jgi:hypothetical protein
VPSDSIYGVQTPKINPVSAVKREGVNTLAVGNLQNDQCLTGTAIRFESSHIDWMGRGFFTRYICSGFVQELEIVARKIKIDGVCVARKLKGDTCVRKP